MNILLTELPTAGGDTAMPSTGQAALRGAAGDQPEGREFALLLHREIAADIDESIQVIDFTQLSVMANGEDGSGQAVVGSLPVADPRSADAEIGIGIGIDRERFTSPPLELIGRVEGDLASPGATLPPGGISLPPPLPDPVPGNTVPLPGAVAASALGDGVGPRFSAVPPVVAAAPQGAVPGDAGQSGSAPTAAVAGAAPRSAAGALLDGWRDSPLPVGDAAAANGRMPAGAAVEATPLPRLEIAAADAVAQRPVEFAASVPMPLTEMRPPGSVAPADLLNLPAGAGAREWGDAVGERINWMISREQSTATLRLDPPSLGKLDVQLRISDEATTITIQTQHAQARDLLDAAAPRLRELLLDNGFQNVNVDVSQREERQQADGGWNGIAEDDTDADAGHAVAGAQGGGSLAAGDRLLDTFA